MLRELSHTFKALALLTLSLVVLGSFNQIVEGKSIKFEKTEEEDPLIALPSDSTHSVQTEPQVQYYTHIAPPEQQVTYQPQDHPAEQSSVDSKHYKMIQTNGFEVEDANYKIHRQEYISIAPDLGTQKNNVYSQDYNSEIVYVDPNSEAQIQPNVEIETHQDRGNEAHSSSLTATILTEIPIRDMPINVLNKLKKDYGVKVVATREYPGANLVINCEDYSVGSESPVCSKTEAMPNYGQQQDLIALHQQSQNLNPQQRQQQSDYSNSETSSQNEPRSDEQGSAQENAQEQPQIPNSPDVPARYEPEQPEGQGGESRESEADEEARNGYVSKISNLQEEKRPADEGAQGQADTESHQMGFDEQSATGAREADKHETSEHYDGRPQRQ